MTGRRLAFLGLLAAVPIACMSTIAGCSTAGPCGWIATRGDFWWPAACSAVAEVLLFLPIVRWGYERQSARAELRADAAAERVAGRPALAGALLVMTAPPIPLAAFMGHAELRARRLLGMRIDEPK